MTCPNPKCGVPWESVNRRMPVSDEAKDAQVGFVLDVFSFVVRDAFFLRER